MVINYKGLQVAEVTDSVFDPRSGRFSTIVEEVRSNWTALLLSRCRELPGMQPVFKARGSLDKLCRALEKYTCDYDALVRDTCTLGDVPEFWDNFAAVMAGVKTRAVMASDMTRNMVVKCKMKAVMFASGSARDCSDSVKCYGALTKAVVEDLDGQAFLVKLDGQLFNRQLAEYYGDASSGLSVLDACCLAEAGERALAGVSMQSRAGLLSWCRDYFSVYTDDVVSEQFTKKLINEILGKQLCCKDFNALVQSVEEELVMAAGYGITPLDRQYLDYALGQVKNHLQLGR